MPRKHRFALRARDIYLTLISRLSRVVVAEPGWLLADLSPSSGEGPGNRVSVCGLFCLSSLSALLLIRGLFASPL